ncbi:hypothetical protein Taro_016908, partial [Colocasia esculenta]|nr:hypothetical protein [Colocasia esculenta]
RLLSILNWLLLLGGLPHRAIPPEVARESQPCRNCPSQRKRKSHYRGYPLDAGKVRTWKRLLPTAAAAKAASLGLQYPRFLSLSSRQEALRAAGIRKATLREFGRSRGNARRSLHNAFFAKVVDAYRGYLSSWVPQCVVSLARLRPVHGRRTRVKHVIGLTSLDEAFHHSWYQSKSVVMADRRDWGGGGDDPEESTQRMIERIWESLTDIRMRMDQQALVPPMIGEAVPVALVPPLPGVEVPFVAPVPPSPPVIAAEEPMVQVERQSSVGYLSAKGICAGVVASEDADHLCRQNRGCYYLA